MNQFSGIWERQWRDQVGSRWGPQKNWWAVACGMIQWRGKTAMAAREMRWRQCQVSALNQQNSVNKGIFAPRKSGPPKQDNPPASRTSSKFFFKHLKSPGDPDRWRVDETVNGDSETGSENSNNGVSKTATSASSQNLLRQIFNQRWVSDEMVDGSRHEPMRKQAALATMRRRLGNGRWDGPKRDLLQRKFQLLRQNQLPSQWGGLFSSSNAPIIDGDWRSSVLIDSSFLLQVYRLCKPPSASVMRGLQWHTHDEQRSSALWQAASGWRESAGISRHEKTEVQVLRTAACTHAQRRWLTGLEQPSCWWIVDSPSQRGRIRLCWDKQRNLTKDDGNKGWDYRLASVSSRGKRMGCYYVPKLVIYIWG